MIRPFPTRLERSFAPHPILGTSEPRCRAVVATGAGELATPWVDSEVRALTLMKGALAEMSPLAIVA